jgi:hypothetical protein
MIYVSSAMDRNRQKGKRLIIENEALKWDKTNSVLPKGTS